ncbi:hypothetical protein GCM10018954_060690 [Kutzneria kofuensis]
MFRLGVMDAVATACLMGFGGFLALAGIVVLTRLYPGLRPDFIVLFPAGAVFFGTGLRWRMVNVYVGGDGVLLRFFWSTRMMPWGTIAAVENVSVNGVFGDTAGQELWFDLTDGSAADTPICHAPWARTGLLRNVRTRYRYDEGFDELRAVVTERAAGEIRKPATAPPATQLPMRRSAAWAKPVSRGGKRS